jgi:hypothetical protein
LIYVDKDGNWFHKGTPMIHKGLIQLFYASLDLDRQGRYTIQFGDQTCLLEVEDTPFVIVETDFVPGKGRNDRAVFMLRLVDGSQEILDPETLFIGAENVLYCRIKVGKFRARFARGAYYQLTRYIEENPNGEGFVLSINGILYPISAEDVQAKTTEQ